MQTRGRQRRKARGAFLAMWQARASELSLNFAREFPDGLRGSAIHFPAMNYLAANGPFLGFYG